MGAKLSSLLNQTVNIPTPILTEKNLPDQTGKVVVITGAYGGIGQELCRILYQKNATVYILGRNVEKANASIAATQLLFPESKGRLEFVALNLADLRSVKGAVAVLLGKEKRIDVLVNNAGVMYPPEGTLSTQGHEIQHATHVLGPYLLTSMLLPLLQDSRILWAGSLVIDLHSPPTGIAFTTQSPSAISENPKPIPSPTIHPTKETNYAQSKAGDLFLAVSFSQRYPSKNLASLSFNPGSLDTGLLRHINPIVEGVAKKVLLQKAIFGAYTELGAGWGDLGKEYEGGKGWYGIPWGRNGWSGLRQDIREAIDEGSVGEKLWNWCDRETFEFR